MGAPLSMYGLLQKIQQLREPTSQRSGDMSMLYVLVLYDNKKHPSIARDIEQNLRHYHRMTGKHVLFFVPFEDFPADLTSGLDQWLDPKAWGGQYSALLNPYRSNQYNPDHEPSFSVSRLAQNLEISDELPCIVVSEDISGTKYFVVPLSENDMTYKLVGDVLQEMTDGANNIKKGLITFGRLNLRNQQYRTLIARSTLAEVWLKSYVQQNESGVVQRLNQLILAYEQLQHEYAELERMTEALAGAHDLQLYDKHDELIHRGMQIWDVLKDVNRRLEAQRRQLAPARQFLNEPWDALEPESLKYWRTANQIMQAIESLHISDDITYAPLIAVLCQLIELEWNYSFVHVIRAALGIQLPLYFAKFDGGIEYKDSCIQSGKKSIAFNKVYEKNKWIPPGMGESRNVFNTALIKPENLTPRIQVNNEMAKVFTRNVANELTQILLLMEKINVYRNNASHGGRTLHQTDFVHVCKLINSLGLYMSLFIELKLYYRGDTYQDIIDKSTNHQALVRAFNHASAADQIAILEYAWQSKRSTWHAFVLACLPIDECDLFLHTDADFIHTHHLLVTQIHPVLTITCDQAAVKQMIQTDIAKVLGTNIATYVSFSAQLSSWNDVTFWFAPLLASSAQACEFVVQVLPRFDTATVQYAFDRMPEELRADVLRKAWREYKDTKTIDMFRKLDSDMLLMFVQSLPPTQKKHSDVFLLQIAFTDRDVLPREFLHLSGESKDELVRNAWLGRDQHWIPYIASVMSSVDYEFLYTVFDVPEQEHATVENAVVHLQEMARQHSYHLGTPMTRAQLVDVLIRHMRYAESTDYLDSVFLKLSRDEQVAVLDYSQELMKIESSGRWKKFWQRHAPHVGQ
jgi:hypothetical protein